MCVRPNGCVRVAPPCVMVRNQEVGAENDKGETSTFVTYIRRLNSNLRSEENKENVP